MQSVSSRIWTHVAISISNNDNHYTTGTSILYPLLNPQVLSVLIPLAITGYIDVLSIPVLFPSMITIIPRVPLFLYSHSVKFFAGNKCVVDLLWSVLAFILYKEAIFNWLPFLALLCALVMVSKYDKLLYNICHGFLICS